MTDQDWTKEPWALRKDDEGYIIDIRDINNAIVLPDIPRNANRIIACVNACAGVLTEDLEHPAFMKCVEHVLKHNLVKKFFADQFEERKRVQEMIDKTPNTTPLHIEGLFKRILDVEVPDE